MRIWDQSLAAQLRKSLAIIIGINPDIHKPTQTCYNTCTRMHQSLIIDDYFIVVQLATLLSSYHTHSNSSWFYRCIFSVDKGEIC